MHPNYKDFHVVDDVIVGNLNNDRKIQISEVSFKESSTCTLFNGLFIETTLNTDTRSDIRFISNSNESLRLGNCTKLKTNNPNFAKEFNVYTNNLEITCSLLTRYVMEKLVMLRTEYGMNYDFVIKNNKLYIRLVTGQLFETSLRRSKLSKEDLLVYYSILNYIELLVNEINKIVDDSKF